MINLIPSLETTISRPDAWTTALSLLQESLNASELKQIAFLFEPSQTSSPSQGIYGTLVQVLEAACRKGDECEAQKYSFTRKKSNGKTKQVFVRDLVDGLSNKLQAYSKMVDPVMTGASQFFPPLGLVWGCFNTILMVS